ncbi:PHD/FYVE-zinc-finger like domain-containing protein [Daldinia vernicosa]|uniref:PHD/FYVE-zinc-finger like domain-containing protein n=1 Tax=Daldinia vernicosa TaxID=114800 RepID=UPI002007D455|nr:PHD/FYVE-zinc-finger like domain-containing protein [Daldinia vernicosa]KAI0845998.1 PHD/FYVE-zinc-finger like domain-containing protein [Daldinia vernicosa]
MQSDQEDSTAPAALQDDAVMDEVRELSHQDLDYDVQDECDVDDSYTKETPNINAEDRQEQEEDIPRATSRLHPIVVELHPPPDPSIYERIYPSQAVERILDEMEDEDGEIYYSVEFEDGYIEDVAYDDMLQLKNGPRAAQQFQSRRFNIGQLAMDRQSDKRPPPEDDYYDSESYGSDHPKKRKRTSSRPTRRSTRQASKQASVRASVENGLEDNGFDEELDDMLSDKEFESRKPSKSRSSARLSSIRVTRSKDPAWQSKHKLDDSEDELARGHKSDQDDDYDYVIPFIRSDIGGAVRASSRKKRKLKRMHTSSRYIDSDSEIEFETSRRSKRSTKASKSMRDPEIDDEYDAVDDKLDFVPKIAAIKEVFEERVEQSEFRRAHAGVCDACGSVSSHAKGSLIPCQGCSYAFHKQCIGPRSQRDHRVTKVGPNDFVLQCRFCIGLHKKKDVRAPSYSVCQDCKSPGVSCAEFSPKRTPKQEEKARLENGGEDPITFVQPSLLNNPDNVLFRCLTCRRAYHFQHLPQLTANPDENRFDEYSLAGWKCKDCLDTRQGIHALVAWRPADQDAYIKGQQADEFSEDEMEYLVKWEGRSHLHDTWMPGAWVYGIAAPTMRTAFHKREENDLPKMTIESAVEEEWVLADVLLNVRYKRGSTASSKAQDLNRISEIQSVYVKFQGLSYEEAVWDEPPPRDSTNLWAAFAAAYDEFLTGKYFPSARDQRMRERISKYRSLDFQESCELKSQPPGLKEGRTLMPYQMEGVNWLLYNFHQQQNVILADEMGLGKTIQIVSFISTLVQDQPKCWPFLIVVPNATCPNWRRELKDWSPALRVVTYHGGRVSQDLAFKHELFPDGVKDGMKAHVVIMSYEAASSVKTTFQSVKWAGLIVDEGQRLKNDETQLYRTLVDMNIPCRILLTGTPLQNNKKELFTLLQFIDPKNNAEALDAQYDELTKENLPELHDLIRPYFLRRTKVQVLKFLPPMAQVIVPVTMTVLQEKLSKSIIARNPELIKAIISKGKMKAGDRKNLSNIMADLRQCLCHPFCFNANVEDKNVSEEQMQRNLIEASPKFMLLEMMLPKLKAGGHRVLIFSQFIRCLDIIEDFLNILGLPFGRIDGQLSALKKQRQIDAFNAPNSPLFAMLLSTRAGGVGINLATADTVIIYDPDWNPHQDIQAISRAHRIGQKEKVLCFQLTTKDTVEENILQTGRKKMALDHALIESLDADNDNSGDLESILKRGAEALFSDRDKVKITYDSAAVDKLLDRSRLESTSTDNQTTDNQFSIARVWANDSGTLTNGIDQPDNNPPTTDASVWENILKAREEEHKRELAAKQEVYGRGARRRGTQGVDYNGTRRPEPDSGGSDIDGEDELYIDNDVEDDDDEVYMEEEEESAALAKNKGAKVTVTEHSQGLEMAKQIATGTLEPPRKVRQSISQTRGVTQLATQPVPQPVSQAVPRPVYLAMPQPYQPVPSNPSQRRAQKSPAGISRPMPQTRVLPPQNPLQPQPPLLHTRNPNFVVSIPRREQPSLAGNSPSSSIIPPAISPSKVLKSNQAVEKATRNLNTSFRAPPTCPTDKSGICLVCKDKHHINKTCIDFNSEISLRLAIDTLRTSGDGPVVQAYKAHLANQLRRLSGS